MSPLIRFTLVLFVVVVSNNSFANTDAATPHSNIVSHFNSSVIAVDAIVRSAYANRTVNPFFAAPVAPATVEIESGWFAKGTHFCSCQILHMSSSNYDHQEMAVFAEKTNRGEGTEFAEAKSRIEKEKKKLKKQFYDKVTVVAEMTAPVSCQSLYRRLKTQNESLQVFDMLDADIK